MVLYGRGFPGRGCGLSNLGRGNQNRDACVEFGACERGFQGAWLQGAVRIGGASRRRGRRPRKLLQCGAPVARSSSNPSGGRRVRASSPSRPERGLWPAPRATGSARRPYGGHQGPTRVVPAAVRGLPGREHHQHDHLFPRWPGLLRYPAPTPA